MLHKETAAAQPSSVDASVRLLMTRMHDIDTRRQITMMHVKECQAKVAFEKGAADAFARENVQLLDREAALRQALQNLVDEQRELQVRHECSKRAHATAETEEPLLTRSAQASLKDAQQEKISWQNRLQEVQVAHAKWQGDSAGNHCSRSGAAARLVSHAENLETELQELLKEEQELVVQLKNLSSAASSCALRVPSAEGEATAEHAHPLPHTVQLEVDQLNAELQAIIKEAEDLELQHQRQMSILGREVKDLASRLVDVEQWATDSRMTTLELESSIAEMHRVLTAGRCTTCLA